MRNIIICTDHEILLDDQVKDYEMGRTCREHDIAEDSIYNFSMKETTSKMKTRFGGQL